MKTIFLFFAALAISTSITYASAIKATNSPMKDCVKMKDGKMWVIKSATSTTTLTDGSQVMTNGTVKGKDGTTKTLKDGDCMDMQGNMLTAKDKMNANCVKMKDGKVWTIMVMDKAITMSNGTVVNTDGTIKTKDGKTVTLANGDCVDMQGNIIKATSKMQD
jgi:hypothetical protein